MISRSFGLDCTMRCELLLSFAYLQDKQNLIAYAHCLANDRGQNAIKLAKKLRDAPRIDADKLVKNTFKNANIKFPEKNEGLFEQIKAIIKKDRT